MNRLKCLKLIAAILAVMVIFAFGGCITASVSFAQDGSGTAVVNVSKDGTDRAELENLLEKVRLGVAKQSQEERLTVKNIREHDDYYSVTVSFKRISATSGLGSFRFMDGKSFGQQRVERNLFKQMAAGNLSKGFTNWNDSTFTVSADEKNGINPVLAESGELLDVNGFISDTNEFYSENNIFFTFVICGFENVQSIEFEFPGKILITSDKNIQINVSKITVTPQKVKATEIGVEEDGTTPFTKNGEYDAFFGYAVFGLSKDYTPFIIAGAAVILLGGLIAAGIFTGLFKKFAASRTFAHIKRHRVLYLFVLPGFVLLAVFNYAPMVGILVAFKNYNVDDGIFGSEWVGLRHFITMFTHPGSEFWMILRNTVVMALLKFIFGFPASIILALMFNALANGIFKKTVQTVSYLPYFVSWVVVSNIVYLFLSANGGIVNNMLEHFGKDPIRFYSEPKYWWTILTGTSVWKSVGWGTIVYLAAITGINPDLYEAASIDGAGSWRKLWTVTIPGMMPVIGIQLILSVGNLIKDDFDQIYSMIGGNNYELREVTEVFSSLVYRNLQGGPKGYSSSTAISLVQSLISLAMVLGANAIVKKSDNQGLW